MKPLVLVHGFMGGRAQWDLQTGAFASVFDVIAVALPGYGDRADAPAISSIAGFADHVIAELEARGIDRFHLLGHSMGGMIAQQIVHQVPERIDRLVLYGTGPTGILPGRFETIDQSKERARIDGIAPTARRIAATWFLERKQATHYPACAGIAAQTSPTGFTGGLDAMQGWSGVEFLRDIRAQTLVLWGDRDRTYPWDQPRALWQSIEQSNLCVVPGCAHAVHMEKPDLFNQLVLDFLTP